jgi:uncharacterized lipoprotein YbaY
MINLRRSNLNMKIYGKTLALTAVISALSMPALAQSASGPGSQGIASADSAGANQAAQMVAAIATLPRTLDADKDHLDSTINAELDHKVTLSDGTVLPARTVLNGKITRDDMQAAGKLEFAIRFDRAQLKNGKIVPIKATIVDIARPTYDTDGSAVTNDWTNRTLSVEQLDVVSGVDLHSEIAGNDSAVFVSTTKHDVKVPAGSELKLAIGLAADASTPTNSTPAAN